MNGLLQEVRCALPKDKPARDLASPLTFVSVSAIPTIVALMVSMHRPDARRKSIPYWRCVMNRRLK